MKIGYYNHTSDVSGAEISLLLQASNLKDAEPLLFAPEGELANRARKLRLPFEPVPGYRARLTRNPFALIRHLAGMTLEGVRLARLIKERQVDIVHANSIRAGLIVSLFRWIHRRPVVWHIRDIPPGGIVGSAVRFVAGRTASALVCISDAVVRSVGDRLRPLAAVVHNGVELTVLSPGEKAAYRRRIREQLGTPPNAKTLAIIGQIAPWKRQEDAVASVRELLSRGHDVVLWVVGEAKFREENERYARMLEKLADEESLRGRVAFTGFRDDVTAICCAADLLLLCSDNEPFGRVVVEAMAQGTPVVATRSGGVPEIVEDGVSGLLYEVGDVGALAHSIEKLLTDDDLRASMGEQAAERVERHFGIDRTVDKVETIYRRIAEKSPGSLLSPNRPLPSAFSSPDHEPLPFPQDRPLRVAIVHDYLNQMGGAERVVGALRRLFPEAPVFTTIVDRPALLDDLKDADIRTTWMQRMPGVLKRFKMYFWLFPFAVRSIDLRGYDLIVSSSSAYAKGVRVPNGAVHVCYCHTPMRFAWSFDDYTDKMELSPLLKRLAGWLIAPLRSWDVRHSSRVDEIVANSSVVRERIMAVYERSVPVVHPPVQLDRFAAHSPQPSHSGDKSAKQEPYFLVVSRLVSYKRIDLAVEACTLAAAQLIVVGDGPDLERLRKLAGPTVTFAGRLKDEEVARLMRGCSALLFPGIEDFGITPLEANACGRPVVAYREGGALDTIEPGLNGLFFERQTPESLAEALRLFPKYAWQPALIRAHAERFGEARFHNELSAVIEASLRKRGVAFRSAEAGKVAAGTTTTTTKKEVTA